MKIFINPGYGGNDPGACANGLREADVALKIGKRVADYLQAVGYDVKLFRFDGLHEICNASDNRHSDLFVSIHCNGYCSRHRNLLLSRRQGSGFLCFEEHRLPCRFG